MIISASYKTDIPAFYGPWFMQRLRAGYCKMVNPYGRQIYTVSLAPGDVDGFVFWTRNIGPFLKYLPEVQSRGYPFLVQYTITGYPRELEACVLDASSTIASLRSVAETYGSAVPIWRYDPIMITSLTPPDWHRRNFTSLARALQGATDEVVVSFAQIYKKARRNLEQAAGTRGFSWHEHESMQLENVRALIADLATIASEHGMQLTICSQKALAIPGVTREARCVDAERLERASGRSLLGKIKLKGNREECGCFASRDIGEYDTCPHGCVYCYAVLNRDLALARYKAHDPDGEFLFPPASVDEPAQLISVNRRQF
ncbi:MAG TPA: DUF1848 domain-containing protein [Ktedonobacteraceae bacterium]|nr:DUF1848 domain-containing protein [Ktedonobacteraceae bacterium]